MNHIALGGMSLIAFVLLALAMDRHQQDLFQRELPLAQTRALRGAGWLVLLSVLGLAVASKGWALGLVAWCGHMSLGATLVILALIVWERRKTAKR